MKALAADKQNIPSEPVKRLSDQPSVRVTAVGSPEDRFGASGELDRCPAVRYPTQTIANKKTIPLPPSGHHHGLAIPPLHAACILFVLRALTQLSCFCRLLCTSAIVRLIYLHAGTISLTRLQQWLVAGSVSAVIALCVGIQSSGFGSSGVELCSVRFMT